MSYEKYSEDWNPRTLLMRGLRGMKELTWAELKTGAVQGVTWDDIKKEIKG